MNARVWSEVSFGVKMEKGSHAEKYARALSTSTWECTLHLNSSKTTHHNNNNNNNISISLSAYTLPPSRLSVESFPSPTRVFSLKLRIKE
jgi:hypothetical protein